MHSSKDSVLFRTYRSYKEENMALCVCVYLSVFSQTTEFEQSPNWAVMFVSARLMCRPLAFPIGIRRWRGKKEKLNLEDENNFHYGK